MYEIHITVEKPKTERERTRLETIGKDYGWSTSCIDGDPVLGKRAYFYFTLHTVVLGLAHDQRKLLSLALALEDIEILREKIEHIVFDTKTGVGV